MRFLAAAFIVLALAATTHAADKKPPKPIRALLVTGGCCHDYTAQKELIAKGLRERAHIDVVTIEQGGRTTNTKIPLYEDPKWYEGFDIILHDECFSDIPDKEWTQRILKPHKEGLPAVVIHCAMHSYRDGTDEWFQFCGVTSRRHGAHYAHEVLNRDAEHPIMKGWGAAWANPAGELYWIEKVWPTAHPLGAARNKEKGNEEVCIWTNEYGEKKTRVFGTTLGHHNETVQSPQFLDVLTRGTLWSCGKLNDEYLKPVQPKEVPVNEAKGKSASASSEETGKSNFAKHAVDGNPSTRWCADGGSFPQWVAVDLGGEQHVTGCRIDWENPAAVYRYQVEGSTDGRSWKTLVDQSGDKESREPEHRFDATLRHLRVTVLGGASGQWASLWEVSVFGDKTVLESPVDTRRAAEEKLLKEVKVPEGFEATLFAAPPAVAYPVFVAAAPDGVVYVSVDRNGSLDRAPHRGSVYRLRDIDGDGRADEVKLFIADVDSPRGLVWDHDRLYLMHPPHLSAFLDKDRDGIADEQKVLVKNIAFDFKDRPADHTSNGVTLGIDGWLYLAIGDFGFLKAEGTDGRTLQLRGGGVVRVRPDGTRLELYSRGTRNILEVALDPFLNGFARDNTNDGGGWDIRLHHFTGLDDHGYPRLFKNFPDEIIPPLADYGGGSGCGALYLSEPGFPEGYGDALYTADWGREKIYRHRMTPKGATFTADQTEFASIPRVTDLDVDAMSRIYATSWKGASFTYAGEDVGYLVRITPKGYRPDPLPDSGSLTINDLVRQLGSASHRRRLEAQRAILRSDTPELIMQTTALLEQLTRDRTKPATARVAALFTLTQLLGPREPESQRILTEIIEQIHEDQFRAVRNSVKQSREDSLLAALMPRAMQDSMPGGKLPKNILNSNDPTARREQIGVAARAKDEGLVGIFWASDRDPVIPHMTIQALIELKAAKNCLAVVNWPRDRIEEHWPVWLVSLRVLQCLHQADVVDGLIACLNRTTESEMRLELIGALARLYHVEGEWKGDSWGTRPDTRGPYYQPETWSESPKIAAALKGALDKAGGEEAAAMLAELSRNRVRLDGTLDRVLALSAANPALIPTAVQQLAAADAIPEAAVALLTTVAAAKETAPAVRSQAITSLLRHDNQAAFRAALAALPALESAAAGQPEFVAARDAFLTATVLDRRRDVLLEESTREGRRSVWSDAGLLVLSTSKQASPEGREIASKAVAAALDKPDRRARLLEAALLANHRDSLEKVYAGLADANAAVVAAAKKVAAAWKLDTQPTPAGPAIKTMKYEDILASVLKDKGTRERGEAIYTRLNCGKCHTIKPDEPLRGPFLPNVVKTYKREQLADSILLPSKTIAQGFVTNVFILDSGRTVTGFIVKEGTDEIVLRDGEGNEIKLKPASIEERVKQNISVMPEGLAKDLPLSDLASLITYLESLAPKEK